MSVTAKVLAATQVLPGGAAPTGSAYTVYGVGAGVTTILDKIVAFNGSDTNAMVLTVAVCTVLATPGTANQFVQKTLQPLETYLFPELTGMTLAEGDRVVTNTFTSATPAVVFRMSGREIT